MDSDIIQGFATLFEGRSDAYGVSFVDHVECWRPHNPITWPMIAANHLEGRTDYGVYPMVLRRTHGDAPERGEWQVKWGCVDLDVKAPGKTRYDFDTSQAAAQAAVDLADHASYDNLMGWIEKTKSGGYHVWFFATDWVSAEAMRYALMALCDEVQVPTTEVNPKNAYLPDHASLGNFVRLMYPGGLLPDYDGTRSAGNLDVRLFVDSALAQRSTPAKYELVANRYRKPMAPAPMPFVGEPVEITKEWLNSLPGFIRFLLKDGMGTQTDRSAWLFRVGCVCKEEGLSPDDASTVVMLADSLHTFKYTERPNSETHYRTIVERAYG